MRNVYACVLKNSSLEIPGNPIFSIADSAAGSLPNKDKESDVVEIECKPSCGGRASLAKFSETEHTLVHMH